MKYDVVITGSTGMVGKGVLLECLDHNWVEKVLVVNRSSINLTHPKLKELLVSDFMDLKNIEDDLKGYNACFFSLGVSSIGISKEDYTKITYELTMHFAKTFLDKNKDSIFTYVTGAGTDSTEKGKVHWARVKGKTENRILDMPFRAAYMFRPGYIHPYRGVGSKIIWVSLLYGIFGILYQILKFFPRTATNSINMGRAMIYCLNGEYKEKILNNKEINEVAKLV